MNITGLAINLFWFAKNFFNSDQSHLLYCIKKGLKERNRYAYECLLFEFYNPEECHKKKVLKKAEKIRSIMRTLPNY